MISTAFICLDVETPIVLETALTMHSHVNLNRLVTTFSQKHNHVLYLKNTKLNNIYTKNLPTDVNKSQQMFPSQPLFTMH